MWEQETLLNASKLFIFFFSQCQPLSQASFLIEFTSRLCIPSLPLSLSLCCFPFQERFLRQTTVTTFWRCLETLRKLLFLKNYLDTSCHYSKVCRHLLFHTLTPSINLNSAWNWARLSTEPQLTSDWWTHVFTWRWAQPSKSPILFVQATSIIEVFTTFTDLPHSLHFIWSCFFLCFSSEVNKKNQ